MSFLSNTQPNRFLLWWHSTYASIESILPLLRYKPSDFNSEELKQYQELVHDASMRVQCDACSSFASELQAQIIAALCNLQTSLDAQAANERDEALSYYHLARVKWIILRSVLEKHGINLK
jgi:hypothetical protein